MSGFVAVLGRDGERVDETMFAALAATLTEYGPDGGAMRHDGRVALAHALFRVRENSSIGPHRSPQGSWLVGDVRVDAQDELRRRRAASPVLGAGWWPASTRDACASAGGSSRLPSTSGLAMRGVGSGTVTAAAVRIG